MSSRSQILLLSVAYQLALLPGSCEFYKSGDLAPFYGEPKLPFDRSVQLMPKAFEKYNNYEKYEPQFYDPAERPDYYYPYLGPPWTSSTDPIYLTEEQKQLLKRLWQKFRLANADFPFMAKYFGENAWKTALQQFEEYEFSDHKIPDPFHARPQPISAKTAFDLWKRGSLYSDKDEKNIQYGYLSGCLDQLKRNYLTYQWNARSIYELRRQIKNTPPWQCRLQIFRSTLRSIEVSQASCTNYLLKNCGKESIDEIDAQLNRTEQ